MGDLEKKAIERIKMASTMSLKHYKQPLVCTYSGGKDSDVMLELFKRSGIPFEVSNSHTTADAPETVYHIEKVFKQLSEHGIKCTIDKHRRIDENGKPYFVTMWNLIPKKLMPPTQIVRYCCSELKEGGGKGRYIATGVRWAESTKRKTRAEFEKIGNTVKEAEKFDKVMLSNDNDAKRRMTELCMQQNKMVVNPIIDWKDSDIWDFIHSEHIQVNPLYECGYHRVGCIGCPMASKMQRKELADFPKYKMAYISAFDRMLIERKKKNLESKWKNGEEVFAWWIRDYTIPGQMSLDDYL